MDDDVHGVAEPVGCGGIGDLEGQHCAEPGHLRGGGAVPGVAGKAEVLATGDSASFTGDLPHEYVNASSAQTARFALTVFEPGVGPGSRSEAADV
ncbi:MAG: hypothetical protein ACLPN6_18085 [Streptosporangiaceae bacterium]